MQVHSHTFVVSTEGFCDIHDITRDIRSELKQSGMQHGITTVIVPGSTAGVTTIEYESGAVSDLKKAIQRLAPEDIRYDHDARWGDGNGFAHVRAALLGPSLTVPVQGGELTLGTWQQIVLVDFDNRPRRREVMIHLMGE
jgi:secondary thiamine-phosphate synthase enzyme